MAALGPMVSAVSRTTRQIGPTNARNLVVYYRSAFDGPLFATKRSPIAMRTVQLFISRTLHAILVGKLKIED